MSQRAGATRPPASPAPSRGTPKLSASTRTPAPPRPYSRTGSRLGQRNDSISEGVESDRFSQSRNGASSYSRPLRSPSRLGSSSDDGELQRLREQLNEKDQQLNDQANTLAEMESSLKEIQSLMPTERPGNNRRPSNNGEDYSGEVVHLRQALKEKNDKIQTLVAEFDAHRADFRSTIDTLELASGETERVYESKVSDLMIEIEELREISHSREDVESVAEQLKALEELVAELEEGLEDARRGEAEARGEVEFLRGEVERGRSELRREREKATEAMHADHGNNAEDHAREMEMKEDEIRGLKAIIHSINSKDNDVDNHGGSSAYSSEGESRRKHSKSPERKKHHDSIPRANSNGARGPSLWCEGCDTEGHDILTCTNFGVHDGDATKSAGLAEDTDGDSLIDGVRNMKVSENTAESPDQKQTNGNAHVTSTGKSGTVTSKPVEADSDKWCALCEKDGHLAFDCPEEQY